MFTPHHVSHVRCLVSPLCPVHSTMHCVQCTVHRTHYTVHSAHYTIHSAQCHSAHFTVHSSQCTVHSAQCTLPQVSFPHFHDIIIDWAHYRDRSTALCPISAISTLHCITLHCTSLNFTTLPCTTLNCTTLNCTALNWTELNWTELNWTALYYTALNYTAMHYIALYPTELQHQAPHFHISILDLFQPNYWRYSDELYKCLQTFTQVFNYLNLFLQLKYVSTY